MVYVVFANIQPDKWERWEKYLFGVFSNQSEALVFMKRQFALWGVPSSEIETRNCETHNLYLFPMMERKNITIYEVKLNEFELIKI
jgi:hypothetical protein